MKERTQERERERERASSAFGFTASTIPWNNRADLHFQKGVEGHPGDRAGRLRSIPISRQELNGSN